jgi:hypothetical protein
MLATLSSVTRQRHRWMDVETTPGRLASLGRTRRRASSRAVHCVGSLVQWRYFASPELPQRRAGLLLRPRRARDDLAVIVLSGGRERAS